MRPVTAAVPSRQTSVTREFTDKYPCNEWRKSVHLNSERLTYVRPGYLVTALLRIPIDDPRVGLLRVADPIFESRGSIDRGTRRPVATIGSGKANPFGRQDVPVSPSIPWAARDAWRTRNVNTLP
jgi:hypothetical protein